MFCPRPCGCKGQRTCLLCEGQQGVPQPDTWVTGQEKEGSYVYCPACNLAWPGWDSQSWLSHPNHRGEPVIFPGVKIMLGFLSEEEEENLLVAIDEVPWDLSQSGRRKQNYGPKCNFKKRRIRCENFTGYPAFTKFIQDRFSTVDILKGFQTVEQCSLEYTVERGASIDPHIDDCWIWGERIPTLSLLTDSTLTLRKFSGPVSKYNLIDTQSYPPVVRSDGTVKSDEEIEREINELTQQVENQESGEKNGEKINCTHTPQSEDTRNKIGEISNSASSPQSQEIKIRILRIPMPRRSLLILYGPARYDWEHSILREDIATRRVCITYRELTPTYLSFGPKAEVGEPVLEAGKNFWDHRSHYVLDA